jgi:RNA polymerase sigma-70 factor (ECF subfamily)
VDNRIPHIQQGDKETFEKMFHEYYHGLCQFANRFLGDVDESEEVVQDTFVKLWQSRDQLTINHSLKSYLYQSVRNKCLNNLKHGAVVREHQAYSKIHSSSEIHQDTMITTELENRIKESVNLLPPERKRVFLMSREEGLSYKEIALTLNISIKTVENQMGRALKFLREELVDFLMIFFVFYLNHMC